MAFPVEEKEPGADVFPVRHPGTMTWPQAIRVATARCLAAIIPAGHEHDHANAGIQRKPGLCLPGGGAAGLSTGPE